MNIFKKIKLANKLIKTYSDVKTYFDTQHISVEVKVVVEALKNDINRLAKLVPALRQVKDDLLEIIK